MSRGLACFFFAILVPSAASAEEITFDEIPPANANAPALGEEYAAMGVHFVASDDGSVWTGVSGGDPGSWGLEGSHGTAFVGFNGASYALSARFDHPVREVAVDVARSAGSRAGDSVVMRGWREGVLVEEQSLVLGDVNAWATLSLAEEVDQVEWVGVGTRRHPFGLDDLRWTAEAQELAVGIDVRPGSARNRVNPFARGVVAVALLGADDLDVMQVDVASLGFGPMGAPAEHARVEDVDGDGHPDLVTLHRIPATGIALGDEEACLTGATLDATALRGCDAVDTVPRRFLGAAGGPNGHSQRKGGGPH